MSIKSASTKAIAGHGYTLPGTTSFVYIGDHGFIYAHTSPDQPATVCVTRDAFLIWAATNYGGRLGIDPSNLSAFADFMCGAS